MQKSRSELGVGSNGQNPSLKFKNASLFYASSYINGYDIKKKDNIGHALFSCKS
jgi:hypothetical protein